VHDIDWDADDRGPLRLVYAYAVMKDGATSKVVVLNRHDIARAKASSQGTDSAYSPWKNHEEAMWLKTAAHRLAKWVPTSAEYMREQLRAVKAAVEAEQVQPPAGGVRETRLEQEADPSAGEGFAPEDAFDVTYAEVVEEETPEGPF